ncbi:MAG: alanine racemase, partial [Methylocystis sp.]|nr:alanine racemase [Methylocystis sp.]
HFDTGMHRLGFACHDAAAVADKAREIAPTVVMSHFVSSQLPQEATNARQITDFLAVRALFPQAAASMCNSSAVYLPEKPHFDLIRPGFALYGGNPTPLAPNPMRTVVRLSARILVVRELAPGDSVGYDAVWTAARPSRVATIGAGYADGVPVSATASAGKPGGEAIVGGARCPFIGRVSMDYVVIDVTEAPVEAAQRGAWVELLGDNIGIGQLAQRAGVIGYEILTRLGRRYARRYVD